MEFGKYPWEKQIFVKNVLIPEFSISIPLFMSRVKQVIVFNSVTKADIKTKDSYRLRKVHKTASHEFQHWGDHISTVWGQKNLIYTYNAMNARILNDEAEFWRLNILWKHINQNKLLKYYTTINEKYQGSTKCPWIARLTCGLRFDHEGKLDQTKPIMFTRFMTQTGEEVCRAPFTVESLLEVNAMASEFLIDIGFFGEFSGEERLVENRLLNDKCMEWLYNPELSAYSIAAHTAANSLVYSDIIGAFFIARAISQVCLNMPECYFNQLRIPKEYREILLSRNEEFIKNRDRGYLYSVIFHNLHEAYKGKSIDPRDLELDEVLEISNLPPLKEIKQKAKEELQLMREEIISGPLTEDLNDILDKGFELFENRYLGNKTESIIALLDKLKIVPTII